MEAAKWALGKSIGVFWEQISPQLKNLFDDIDILLEQNGENAFTWGRNIYKEIIETEGSARKECISSLQSADKNDYKPLLNFVRS